MSYLPVEELMLLRATQKIAKEQSDKHWEVRLCEMAVQIEQLKNDQFHVFSKKIPLLFEGGFLSPFTSLLNKFLLKEKDFLSRNH